jgi:tRNA U34 2-thiouridine synthase MnmA/TrmU
MKKAIVLVSGGLDSTLAAALIKQQGIEVVALNFKSIFCLCNRKNASGCINHAQQAAKNLGIDLRVINITEEVFKVIKKPKHGFGSNMNPCIDCRILKFRKAKELMEEINASFIVTGEVLGQRPMSQYRRALEIIEKESGLEGLVLRPLSGRLLPETIPERQGWLCREKLLDFSGRTRKPQIELAKKLDIKDYPCPAGGCLLTDPEFSKRLKDLMQRGELNINNIELLKLGRHFRLNEGVRLVVGRDEKENAELARLAKESDYLFFPNAELAGPTSLGRGEFSADLIRLAGSITCRYCDLNGQTQAEIIYRRLPESGEKKMQVSAALENELNSLRI